VLGIDSHGYSASILVKIVRAGAECKSFQKASQMLKELAEVGVSHTQVARLTHEVGRELIEERDRQSDAHRRRQLGSQVAGSPVELACVETDGGRMMTRSPQSERGVHTPQWKEPKVAALWRMTGETFDEDPHPELPACFGDREHVEKLVRELKGFSCEEERQDEKGAVYEGTGPGERSGGEGARWQPERVFRTCVASLRDVYGFGPLVAAEAQRRGFYEAHRKAFLGDGHETNWIIHRLYFSDFTDVVDFMHVVGYLYAAAHALSTGEEGWSRYLTYATACWQGRVDEVIGELAAWLQEHPLPEGVRLQAIPDHDPSKIVHSSLTYLRHNRKRMNYPEYRRQGLTVSSSLVESLIKEINWRVKGTEKFWNRPEEPRTSRRTGRRVRGASYEYPAMSGESILQVRAAVLGDDDRLAKHIHSRPGCPFYRRDSLPLTTSPG